MGKHVIIIHEIYGVTEALRELKRELESSGYTVSLPSLYEDNYTGTDEETAYRKFYDEVGLEKACNIVDDLILENDGSEIILLGFSVGATVAWLHSVNSRVHRVICVYGSRIRDYTEIEPVVKTDIFFCAEKSFDVFELHDILKKKKNVSSAIIPGVHGFYNRGDLYPLQVEEMNRYISEIISEA